MERIPVAQKLNQLNTNETDPYHDCAIVPCSPDPGGWRSRLTGQTANRSCPTLSEWIAPENLRFGFRLALGLGGRRSDACGCVVRYDQRSPLGRRSL